MRINPTAYDKPKTFDQYLSELQKGNLPDILPTVDFSEEWLPIKKRYSNTPVLNEPMYPIRSCKINGVEISTGNLTFEEIMAKIDAVIMPKLSELIKVELRAFLYGNEEILG